MFVQVKIVLNFVIWSQKKWLMIRRPIHQEDVTKAALLANQSRRWLQMSSGQHGVCMQVNSRIEGEGDMCRPSLFTILVWDSLNMSSTINNLMLEPQTREEENILLTSSHDFVRPAAQNTEFHSINFWYLIKENGKTSKLRSRSIIDSLIIFRWIFDWSTAQLNVSVERCERTHEAHNSS